MFDRRGAVHTGDRFDKQATNLNDRPIEVARESIYWDYALRNPPLYKSKYFSSADGCRLKVKDEVESRITRLNLNEGSRVVFMKGWTLSSAAHTKRRRRLHQLLAPENRRGLGSSAHPHHPRRGLPDWRQIFLSLTIWR